MPRLPLLAFIALLATPASALPIKLPDDAEIDRRVAAFPVDVTRLPAHVTAAFIAQEDRFFRERHAAGKDSTLTQAAVRLLIAGTPTDWVQASPLEKEDAVEAMTAAASADEILSLYLNLIPLGEDIAGLEAGARTWFDKAPDALTPAEAAYLAVLSRAPVLALKPANRERTKSQRDYVLRQMQKMEAITESELSDALSEGMPER